jgi:hypothetical protein
VFLLKLDGGAWEGVYMKSNPDIPEDDATGLLY